MIFTFKNKYSGQDEQYEVSDSLCEYKRITSSTPVVMETDTAYVLEPEKGKRAYLNKSHCKKVILYERF